MANEDNLKPFTGADDPRRMNGKPKGTKHLSTIIRELADDIDWSKTTLNNKEELAKKYGKNGFKAMAYVAFTKAMTGDTRAMEWLAKHGYGEKLDIDLKSDIFSGGTLNIKVLDGRSDVGAESEAESGSGSAE